MHKIFFTRRILNASRKAMTRNARTICLVFGRVSTSRIRTDTTVIRDAFEFLKSLPLPGAILAGQRLCNIRCPARGSVNLFILEFEWFHEIYRVQERVVLYRVFACRFFLRRVTAVTVQKNTRFTRHDATLSQRVRYCNKFTRRVDIQYFFLKYTHVFQRVHFI